MRFYTDEINKNLTSLFGVDGQCAVINGRINRSQFPLKLAVSSMIHAA